MSLGFWIASLKAVGTKAPAHTDSLNFSVGCCASLLLSVRFLVTLFELPSPSGHYFSIMFLLACTTTFLWSFPGVLEASVRKNGIPSSKVNMLSTKLILGGARFKAIESFGKFTIIKCASTNPSIMLKAKSFTSISQSIFMTPTAPYANTTAKIQPCHPCN